MDKQDELAAVIAEAFHLQEGPNMVLDLSGPQWPSSGLGLDGAFDISAIAAAVRSFMGSPEVVERVSSAIASNVRLEWHGHDHAGINPRSVVVAARAALSAAIGEDIGGGRG